MNETEHLPALNLELATTLIHWAEVSEAMKDAQAVDPQDLNHFRGWGVWDQETWAYTPQKNVCGTAYCQAGQAAVQTGWKIPISDDGDATYAVKGDRSEFIGDVGRDALGLTDDEADDYFNGDNTIETLKILLNQFADKRGLPIPYPS